MYRLFSVILLALFLNACATSANYEKILDSWVGSNVDELVISWGYPVNSFKAPNGNTVYAYSSSSSYTMPTNTTSNYNVYGNSVYGSSTTTGGQTLNYSCQTFFEVNENNIITTWRWKGNSCKSM
jgi:hypothetical protein